MAYLILVADDDPDNRIILAAALRAAGYRVCLAEDGVQAVAEARRQLPDLVLMDMSMPILDGYAATRQLKSDPELGRVPVLAVTARALAGDEAKARAAGCDGYIAKPCLPSEMLRRVAGALSLQEIDHARHDLLP